MDFIGLLVKLKNQYMSFVTIGASNQMITCLKNTNYRLNYDEPKKLIKGGQDYPFVVVQLA